MCYLYPYFICTLYVGDISDEGILEMESSLENDDSGGHRSEDSLPMHSENTVEGSILYVQYVDNLGSFVSILFAFR